MAWNYTPPIRDDYDTDEEYEEALANYEKWEDWRADIQFDD